MLFRSASSLALVSSSTPKSNMGYAISFLQTSISSGNMIGPLLGGVISDYFGVRQVFFVVAGLCFLSSLVVIFFVKEKKREPNFAQKTSGLSSSISYVLKNFEMKQMLLFIALSQTAIVISSPIFAYYLEKLGTPNEYLATITGFMVAIVGLLTTIFGPIWGKKNDSQYYKKTLQFALPFFGLSILLQGFVSYYI